MPLERATKATRKTPLQLAADREIEDMRERAGIGPRALEAKAKRLKRLLGLERNLTRDEQDEQDALIIERQTYRRQGKAFAALTDAARERWAERSVADPDWVAKWEKRAEESRRRYGSGIDADGAHFVHVITSSKQARRIARQAERGHRLVLKIEARRARRAERARRADQPAEPLSPMPAAPIPAAAVTVQAEPLEAVATRRQRIKYGVVRVDDADGNRVF